MFIVNLYKTGVVKCSIRKNGIGVAWVNVLADSGNGLNGSSGSILLHLNPGDEVYVGYCENPSIIDNWTTFIGFLLKAD